MSRLCLLFSLPAFLLAPAASGQSDKKAPRPRLVRDDVRVEKHLYRTAPEGKLHLHVYHPADWKATDSRPVVVFFFGGGWKNGSPEQFQAQSEYFATRGLVA